MDKLYLNIGDISENHYNYLMNLENVNGVGYGSKYINNKKTFEPCIHVLVKNKKDNKYLTQNNIIPKKYMGIKTDVIEVGLLKNFSTVHGIGQYLKDRPLCGGSSIMQYRDLYGYGTICCIVKKKNSKKYGDNYYILSNNHVLANYNKTPIGTMFTQPVSSSIEDVVATLNKFVPIKFYNKFNIFSYNTVDCAIAKLLDTTLISNRVISCGEIKGVAKAVKDMYIKKSGAESGVTEGFVSTLNTTVTILSAYGDRKLVYKKQIVAQMGAYAGDSGSPVLTESDNKLIGLLHSGNQFTTVISDINLVLKKLKVEVYLG